MERQNISADRPQRASVLRVGRRLATPASFVAAIPFIVFLVVYGPTAGRGFISDDFRWILESRIRRPAEIPRLFVETTGFYRPVVSLSFAANEWFGGTNPRWYGVVNLALALTAALAVMWMARRLRLPAGAGWFAAGVWLLNLHGINMAVLWISGRTALLLVLFCVLAAIAVLRRQWLVAGLLTLLAMLSKEEAVLLPVSLLALAEASDPKWRATWRTVMQCVAPLAVAAIVYFALRSGSDAMVPSTAPDFYRFTFDTTAVLDNAVQYLDRGATVAVFCLVLTAALVRRLPRLTDVEKRALAAGVVWFIAGYSVTVFLPARSSLYACFPAVGSAIGSASIVTAFWRVATERHRKVLLAAAALLPLVLIPIYQARTDRWTELAAVSRGVFRELQLNAGSARTVLFVDSRATRANIWSAFGSLLPDAIQLATGRRPAVWVVPPPPDIIPDTIGPVPPGIEAGWMLRGTSLERADAARWVSTRAVVLK